MSEENVDKALEVLRCFQAGDFEGVAAFFHPDVTVTPPEGWPEPGPFIGKEAATAQYEQTYSQFEEHEIDLKAVEARGDWVIIDYKWKVRGAGSGVEVEFDATGVARFEDGLVRENHQRWDHAEALKAAGLEE